MAKPVGWRNESRRHALASKGIKTAIAGKPLSRKAVLDDANKKVADINQHITDEEVSAPMKEEENAPKTIPMRVVMKADSDTGHFFFSPDAIKFFNSKVGGTAYLKKGSETEGYFVTSEKYKDEPRKYTIRNFDLKTGYVGTEGEFQAYATEAGAKSALQKLLGAKIPSKRPFRWERSQQYRSAKKEDIDKFVGLKSQPYEGRSFTIDESDARLIVANLKKSEYDDFKNKFKNKSASSFRLLQDYAGEHS